MKLLLVREYQIGAESFGTGAAVDGIGATTKVGVGTVEEPESTIVYLKALLVTADSAYPTLLENNLKPALNDTVVPSLKDESNKDE